MVIKRRDAIALIAGMALSPAKYGRPSTHPGRDGDDSDSLIATFADMAETAYAFLPGGTYKVSKPLVLPPGVIEGGNIVFDFSEANPKNFPDGICVLVKGASRMRLRNLQRDLPIGTRMFRFEGPHGLLVGDAFQLSGTVDYAGNGYRSYYRKGEIFRVARVVDKVTLTVENACRDHYPARGVEVWKRAGDRFTQGCTSLAVIGHDSIDYTVKFESLDRSTLSNLRCERGFLAALYISDCFQSFGENVRARQTVGGSENPYGCIVGNSQEIRLGGEAYGYFNGFSIGGGNPVDGQIGMNRDVHFQGRAGSHPTAGLSGGNIHGNCEHCSLRGVFANGISMGGNWNEAHGEFTKSASPPIVLSELHGHDFKITGTLRTAGVSDLATNVGAMDQSGYGVHARYGGLAEIDLKMYVSKATRILVWRPLGLRRTDVYLKLKLDIMAAHPKTRIIALKKIVGSGDDLPVIEFERLNLVDNAVPIQWSISNGTRLAGAAVRAVLAAQP